MSRHSVAVRQEDRSLGYVSCEYAVVGILYWAVFDTKIAPAMTDIGSIPSPIAKPDRNWASR